MDLFCFSSRLLPRPRVWPRLESFHHIVPALTLFGCVELVDQEARDAMTREGFSPPGGLGRCLISHRPSRIVPITEDKDKVLPVQFPHPPDQIRF